MAPDPVTPGAWNETMARVIQVPKLGPAIPRRGNVLTRGLGAFGLWLLRWRFEGEVPDRPRVVIVVAPHTSNWDFVVGFCAALALGFRYRFLGKDALFRPPYGWFMRWAGGIPVNRKAPDGVMEAAVASFRNEAFFLAITPEGTRRRVERWKTGFWRIAREAEVPVWTVALDWSRRVVRLDPPFETSADREADVRTLQARFTSAQARRPEDYGVAG
jgi:1-acyl-sn-glycerol-3-phosphate acyltransferase